MYEQLSIVSGNLGAGHTVLVCLYVTRARVGVCPDRKQELSLAEHTRSVQGTTSCDAGNYVLSWSRQQHKQHTVAVPGLLITTESEQTLLDFSCTASLASDGLTMTSASFLHPSSQTMAMKPLSGL